MSLPGRPTPSSADLRRISSRACLAAARAWAACTALVTTAFGLGDVGVEPDGEVLVGRRSTAPRIDVLPSLAFVWPSNCGSSRRTATMAVRPSRTSSPCSAGSRSAQEAPGPGPLVHHRREGLLEALLVGAALGGARSRWRSCGCPRSSRCSTGTRPRPRAPSSSASKHAHRLAQRLLRPLRWATKSAMPPW